MDYKEKLRLAKEALDSGSYDKETIEYIFPELKESEDERIKEDIISYIQLANQFIPQFQKDKWIAWLEKQGEQNPAWSEEDEKMVSDIDNCIKNLPIFYESIKTNGEEKTTKQFVSYARTWLKSIKDRVQLKQEWSKDDERTYKSITYSFAHNYPLTVQQQEFVKSIKDRCTWKPSDKQLNNLLDVLSFDNCTLKRRELLKSLYNDLKKLR